MSGQFRNILGTTQLQNMAQSRNLLAIDDNGLIAESVTDNIAAAGANQAGATPLTTEISRVTSGTGGVVLPASIAGVSVFVINHSGAAIQVYANGSDQVDDVAGSTGVAQMNGSLCLYSCATAGNWYSNGIGTGFSGAYPTVSYTNGITAFATGGQTSATLLTTALNRVTVVGTAGDSVKLPVAVAGMQITVFNASANSLNVFPNAGDQINSLGTNNSYALAAGKTATFFSTAATFWHALLSA